VRIVFSSTVCAGEGLVFMNASESLKKLGLQMWFDSEYGPFNAEFTQNLCRTIFWQSDWLFK